MKLFQTTLFAIVILDTFLANCRSWIFGYILRIIFLYNFFANCCSGQLFFADCSCKQIILQICELWQLFYNLLIRFNLLQFLQITNQPDNPTQSDHFNHPDRPKLLYWSLDYSSCFDHPHHIYHFDHFCVALVVEAIVYQSSSFVERLSVWHRRLHTLHIA